MRTIDPPIDLFEDIAAPADWEALLALEERINPRIRDQVGDLSLIPVARRVTGPGASIVMGCFTHASPSREADFPMVVMVYGMLPIVLSGLGRDGLAFETIHAADPTAGLHGRCKRAGRAVRGKWAESPHGWLKPDDWRPGQTFADEVRTAGGDVVVHPSARYPLGQAVALFWPDCIQTPVVQARQFRYSWNGTEVDRYFIQGEREWRPYPSSRPSTRAV